MNNSELCVPMSAVALASEGGSDVQPAVGDEVDISGTATVSRVEGDKVYLTPTTINGENVETAAEKKPMSLDDEEDELRRDAGDTDKAPRLY